MVGVPSSRSRFQSTLPLRGATHGGMGFTTNGKISIHTPLAGSDRRLLPGWNFQYISIHTPLAGSDVTNILVDSPTVGISIHTPLAGSDIQSCYLRVFTSISIHTPLAGSDRLTCECFRHPKISIHTPLAGSDRTMTPIRPFARLFQSTLPLRGATDTPYPTEHCTTYFNPHSPCGERLIQPADHAVSRHISIHTPLAGSDRPHL